MSNAISLSRRSALGTAAGIVAGSLVPALSHAQAAWPAAPIRMIVPFGTGGSTDVIARYVAANLSTRLGQQVVVENRVGAGGVVGTVYGARQPPDGYTLVFQASPYLTAPLMTKRTTYDPLKDLQPIGMLSAGPFMLVVRNDLKVTNVRELIELAKVKSLTFGTPGVGTLNHLGMEMLAKMANIKLLHVPYTALGQVITDFLGGNIDLILAGVPTVLSYVRAGKMRPIGVTSAQRTSILPDVQTIAETVPGYELELWLALFGPAGLPTPIVKRLNEEINAIVAAPEMTELLARDGATRRSGTPEDLAKVIRTEFPQWRTLVQERHLAVD